MTYQKFLTDVLQVASDIANKHYGKVSSTTKTEDNNQVLTQADIEIGKFLIEEVQKSYPNYNVIDEETGIIDKKSDYTWVIDPIDGTSNFANGIPTYGIMIGLLNKDLPISGGIALPFFSEIAVAEKGEGAFCNDEKLNVTSEENLLKELIAYGIDGHQENPKLTKDEVELLGKIILNIRNLRTSNSVFDVMMVAKGSYGGMLNRTSKIWDNVAQQVVLEEAGAIYTDFWGKPIDYSSPLQKANANFTFCSASQSLHRQLQSIIHQPRT